MKVIGNTNRWTLDAQLLLAIKNSDVSRASQLFTQGVDTDTRFHHYKKPALCLSVENNDTDMVRMMLNVGAGVNQCDEDGESPLHIACKYGFDSIAKLLLEYRANPCVKNKTGMTPLHFAAATGKVDVIRFLLLRGANKEALNFLGQTPLHLASQQRDPGGVSCLLNEGSNARTMDKRGNTPLHYAVEAAETHLQAIDILAKHYPLAPLVGNACKKTPLHIIVNNWREDSCQVLRSMLKRLPLSGLANHPIALSPRTERGHTPLHMAVLEKNIVLVRVFVAAGSRIDTRDQLGRTPLEAAVRDSDPGIVAILLSAGATTRRIVERSSIITNEKIREMIEFSAANPLSLSSLCRRTLTTNFGPAMQDYIVDLPKSVRDFMNYEYL